MALRTAAGPGVPGLSCTLGDLTINSGSVASTSNLYIRSNDVASTAFYRLLGASETGGGLTAGHAGFWAYTGPPAAPATSIPIWDVDGAGAFTQMGTAFDVDFSNTAAPALHIPAAADAAATGLQITQAAPGSGVALAAISTVANEGITLDAKGTGVITVGGTSTGGVVAPRLQYGATAAIGGAVALTAAQSGGVFIVTNGGAYQITIPAPSAGNVGLRYLLIGAAGAAAIVNVSAGAGTPLTGTLVRGNVAVAFSAGAANVNFTATSAAGDSVELTYISATQIHVRGVSSNDAGLTFT